jgi:transketolase
LAQFNFYTQKRNTQQLKDLTIQVRRDILRMVHNVNSGHPDCTEFMVALYQNLMDRKEGFDMDGIEKIFSSFQTDISVYSVLARSGYFPVSELATFRLINSRLQGHPTTHDGLPGIRIASGSLGQGMSVGIELLKN